MKHRIIRKTTRSSDTGRTTLAGRSRVAKADPWIGAIGAVDNLNGFAGARKARSGRSTRPSRPARYLNRLSGYFFVLARCRSADHAELQRRGSRAKPAEPAT